MAQLATFGHGGYTSYATCVKDMCQGEDSQLWIAVGQADEWDGGVAPEVDPSVFPNPIYYKRATFHLWRALTQDEIDAGTPTPTLTYRSGGVTHYGVEVTDAEARDNYYHFLYTDVRLWYDDVVDDPLTLRAIGFYTHLIPTSGNEDKDILLPAEVSNAGNLLALTHLEYPKILTTGDSFLVKWAIALQSTQGGGS